LQEGASVSLTADRGISIGAGIMLSVQGARPSQNSFQLDGLRVNDATGSAPWSAAGRSLGVETIQELRVVSSPFSADLGGAAGAIVTAVSRSGSNAWHGSAFEFLRNSAMDARNYFDDPGEAKPPLRRNQFGGQIGGPLRRNRLFGLGSYEGLRESRSATVRPSVPTLDARRGLLPAPGGVRQVTVSPAVRPYLDLFPTPNGRDFGDGSAEFINQVGRTTREDYVAGKIDFLATPALRWGGRYTGDWSTSQAPEPLNLWRFLDDSAFHLVHTEAQYVPSSNTIYNLRGGFSRVWNRETNTNSIPPSLSFVQGLPMGQLDVTGLESLGGTRARAFPRRYVLNEFQLNSDVTHIRGAHEIRLGGGFTRSQFNEIFNSGLVGRYQFTSLENFLGNRARRSELQLPHSDTVRGWRQSQFFAYLQDDYRISSRMSFSIGLRYEAYSVPSEVNGKVATLRNPETDRAVTVGGSIFRNPSKDNFAPRASFAWDPLGSGRTVLRAGGGIFFDRLGSRELANAGVRLPPFFDRANVDNPPFPDIVTATRNAPSSLVLDGLEWNVNQPYTGQWQLSVERRWSTATIVRIAYAGARGVHLLGQVGNVNTTRPQFLNGGVFFPENTPRLNPAFDSVGYRKTQFNSFYHGLLLSLDQRFRSFQFRGNYSWSKTLDEVSNSVAGDFLNDDLMPMVFQHRLNRGPAAFDIRHRFTAAASYSAPSRLGGWELHGVCQVQTGFPFAPSVGFDRARLQPNSGDQGQRPDLAGNIRILGDPALYFDPLAFSLPAPGILGNAGRGIMTGPGVFVLDLAVHKVLWKRESHAVRLRVEAFNATGHPNFSSPSGFRLFNSSGQRLGTAGRIDSTSTPPRQIQVALRYSF
jgi:hypothetical protein